MISPGLESECSIQKSSATCTAFYVEYSRNTNTLIVFDCL